MSTPLTGQLCALITTGASGRVTAELIALARHHRVQLLLGDRVVDAELANERRAAAAIEALRETELGRVLTALDAANLRAIVFKGAAIARTHYAAPELRVRSDTDILVPADRTQDVARVLATLGYRRAIETDGELIASQFHWDFVDRAGLSHALDVHWRISNVIAFADRLSYDEIAREALPLPGLGAPAWGPSAVHSLVLACVHRIGHHPDSTDLLWLYDLHRLAERFTPGDERQLMALVDQRRLRAICAACLRDAAAAFGGKAGDLAARLAPPDGTHEPTAALLAVGRRPIDLLTADLRALGGWPQRWQLLREHVFPRRDYMFARYGTHRSWSLPWLYLRRIVAGAPKWFRW